MYIPNKETEKITKKKLYTACNTKICTPLYTSFKGHYFIVYTFRSAGTKRNQIIYQSTVATKFKTVQIATLKKNSTNCIFHRNMSQICIKSLGIVVIIYKLKKKYTKVVLPRQDLQGFGNNCLHYLIWMESRGKIQKKEVGY